MRYIHCLLLILLLSVFANAQQASGQAAHNFSETTITGESIELSSLKGKVVVLTFWSTRCPICAEEIPLLNRLTERYEPDDVVFVGLAWQGKTRIEQFMKKRPFKFKIIPRSFGVLLKYANRDSKGRLNMGFPSYFVVSQEGDVVYKASGFDKTQKIDSTIRRLLSSALAKKD